MILVLFIKEEFLEEKFNSMFLKEITSFVMINWIKNESDNTIHIK